MIVTSVASWLGSRNNVDCSSFDNGTLWDLKEESMLSVLSQELGERFAESVLRGGGVMLICM